jgi:purine-binding chemotaxis protein CheW
MPAIATDRPAAPPWAPAVGRGPQRSAETIGLRLGERTIVVERRLVQELRAWEPPIRMAHAPGCVQGVINVRGALLPCIDLRLLLLCSKAAPAGHGVVVVARAPARLVGLVVDGLASVDTGHGDCEAPPPLAIDIETMLIHAGLGAAGKVS